MRHRITFGIRKTLNELNTPNEPINCLAEEKHELPIDFRVETIIGNVCFDRSLQVGAWGMVANAPAGFGAG